MTVMNLPQLEPFQRLCLQVGFLISCNLMLFTQLGSVNAQNVDRDIANTPIGELFGRKDIVPPPKLTSFQTTTASDPTCERFPFEPGKDYPQDFDRDKIPLSVAIERTEALEELRDLQHLTSQVNLFADIDARLAHSLDRLDQTTKIYGSIANETMLELGNHALLLQENGDYATAILYLGAAIQNGCLSQGVQDQSLLIFLARKAHLLQLTGNIERAEVLHSDILSRRSAALGSDHPDTIDSLEAYALILVELDREQEAKPLLAKTYQSRKRSHRENDPAFVASVNNYAFVLDSLEEYDEAEPLYRRAIDLNGEIFEESNPQYIASLRNYATVLANLERYSDAEKYAREGMELSLKHLPDHDPGTPIAIHNLALIVDMAGREREARSLEQRAFSRAIAVYGENHSTTDSFRQDLWYSYLMAGDNNIKALELGRKAVSNIRRSRNAGRIAARDMAGNNRSRSRKSLLFARLADSLWSISTKNGKSER